MKNINIENLSSIINTIDGSTFKIEQIDSEYIVYIDDDYFYSHVDLNQIEDALIKYIQSKLIQMKRDYNDLKKELQSVNAKLDDLEYEIYINR